jgi:hypothetical protein
VSRQEVATSPVRQGRNPSQTFAGREAQPAGHPAALRLNSSTRPTADPRATSPSTAVQDWLSSLGARTGRYLFSSRFQGRPHIWQYARIVHGWVARAGLNGSAYGTDSPSSPRQGIVGLAVKRTFAPLISSSRQVVEQRFGILQIGGVEAFGEPSRRPARAARAPRRACLDPATAGRGWSRRAAPTT